MQQRFGISLVTDRLQEFADWSRIAEREGFTIIGLTDSPSVYVETYVSGAVCALNTTSVRFGVRATNPVTRHPLVTAAAVLALDELSDGRAMVGIGSGDSGVHQAGLRPARVAHLERYTVQVIGLLEGREIDYDGVRIRLERVEATSARRRPRVYVAAAGQKTLRMAARIADGIIIGTGIRPDIIDATLEAIAQGAADAGRSLEDLDLWWLAACCLAEDRGEAIEETRGTLAAMCNATFRVTYAGKHLPVALHDRVQHLVDAYDFHDHVKPGRNTRNSRLLEDPELRRYVADRFLVGGSADECVDQLQSLARQGVTQLWWTMALQDKVTFMRDFSENVMARLPGRREGSGPIHG